MSLLEDVFVLGAVAGHLRRVGENHSADTISEVMDKLYKGLAPLVARVERAEADTARLDWLQENRWVSCVGIEPFNWKDWREAIDAVKRE